MEWRFIKGDDNAISLAKRKLGHTFQRKLPRLCIVLVKNYFSLQITKLLSSRCERNNHACFDLGELRKELARKNQVRRSGLLLVARGKLDTSTIPVAIAD